MAHFLAAANTQAISGPRFMYRALDRWLGGTRNAHSVCWMLHLV